MASKFDELLKKLRAMSHEVRMERVREVARVWAEREERRRTVVINIYL